MATLELFNERQKVGDKRELIEKKLPIELYQVYQIQLGNRKYHSQYQGERHCCGRQR